MKINVDSHVGIIACSCNLIFYGYDHCRTLSISIFSNLVRIINQTFFLIIKYFNIRSYSSIQIGLDFRKFYLNKKEHVRDQTLPLTIGMETPSTCALEKTTETIEFFHFIL